MQVTNKYFGVKIWWKFPNQNEKFTEVSWGMHPWSFSFFSLKSFCVKAHSERTIWEESSTVEVQRILISINLWTNFLLIKGEYRISQKKRSSMVTEFPLNHDFQILWCLKWCHMVEEKPDYLHLKNLNVLNILGLVKEMPSFYCFKFLSA